MQAAKTLPWRYECNISQTNSLFKEHSLGYGVEAYYCYCGARFFRTKDIVFDENSRYVCECGNEEFFDANEFLNEQIWDSDKAEAFFKANSSGFGIETHFDAYQNTAFATLVLTVPSSLDFIRERLIFKSIAIYKYSIKKSGAAKVESILSPNGEGLFVSKIGELKRELTSFITTNGIFEDKTPVIKECKNTKEIQFFLQNPHLRDYGFLKWKNVLTLPKDRDLSIEGALNIIAKRRNGRSLKKAVFINYKFQMALFGGYSSHFVECVLKYIRDINVARRMLEMGMYKYFTEDEYIKCGLNTLLPFLAERYTDIGIENLLLSYADKEIFWVKDSVSLLRQMKREWIRDMPKPDCNPEEIHNSLSNYYNLMRMGEFAKAKFEYDEKTKEACKQIKEYSVKLPSNGKELYEWANELNNCLASYIDSVMRQKTTIYGFFEGDKLKFAVEIREQKLIQAKAKNNRDIDDGQKRVVDIWMTGYILDKKKEDSPYDER